LYGAGTKIVVFKGEEADAFEKIKALSIAKEMESERHGKSTVVRNNTPLSKVNLIKSHITSQPKSVLD
jgi:hypothetical protein